MWGLNLIKPAWEVPAGINVAITTRDGGVSDGKYANFNLSSNVGDSEDAVGENRMRLQLALQDDPKIAWINQEHKDKVLNATEIIKANKEKICDAVYAAEVNQACVVCTADCMPIFFASLNSDKKIAIAHVGWRGLCNNILFNVAQVFNFTAFTCYIGPCISQVKYPVGEEVVEEINKLDPPKECIDQIKDKYYIDLAKIAQAQLKKFGAANVETSDLCTFTENEKFFSARRDGIKSGRFASVIWRSNLYN